MKIKRRIKKTGDIRDLPFVRDILDGPEDKITCLPIEILSNPGNVTELNFSPKLVLEFIHEGGGKLWVEDNACGCLVFSKEQYKDFRPGTPKEEMEAVRGYIVRMLFCLRGFEKPLDEFPLDKATMDKFVFWFSGGRCLN
jgi:hypothetical protein